MVVDAPWKRELECISAGWKTRNLTTSFGGTSPSVFLQKVVRSEIGYMTA